MNDDARNLEIEVITSRRALIDVITGLADHREALPLQLSSPGPLTRAPGNGRTRRDPAFAARRLVPRR